MNDNHVENNLKEMLVYVYFGSIVNIRPKKNKNIFVSSEVVDKDIKDVKADKKVQ